MAKSNIVFRSYRLNLDNEQQRRVNRVLAELNTDIHKSVNQFIISQAPVSMPQAPPVISTSIW